MYLREVAIGNHLCHRATTIPLKPLTVLVGPCGGGKSAVFDAMINFSMLARGNIREAFGPGPFSHFAAKFHGAQRQDRIAYSATVAKSQVDDPEVEYEIDYEQEQRSAGEEPVFRILNERLEQRKPNRKKWLAGGTPDPTLRALWNQREHDRGILAAIRQAHNAGTADGVDDFLKYLALSVSRVNKTRFDPFELRQAADLPDPTFDRPFLGFRGQRLPALLYQWHTTDPGTLSAIEDEIRKVIPTFEKFEFQTVGTGSIGLSIRYSDNRCSVPAPKLSDGTLLFVGLVVLLKGPSRPPLLCLEEPENGLNPPAIRAVYELMRTAALEGPADQRTQILFSSHSPLVLCDAWNGADRDFIYQVQIENGAANVIPMAELLKNSHLGTTKQGGREHMSFSHACEILAGNR